MNRSARYGKDAFAHLPAYAFHRIIDDQLDWWLDPADLHDKNVENFCIRRDALPGEIAPYLRLISPWREDCCRQAAR
jgi:hypothetical protein